MNIRDYVVVVGLTMLLTGCAKPYAMPVEGEPAAIVKVQTAYDHAKALAAIPANGTGRKIIVDVTLVEEDKTYILASKAYPDAFAGNAAAPLEVLALRLHPDRDAAVTVGLSVFWNVSAMETVYKEERKPKQVSKQVSSYNYSTKKTEYRTETVTEYETIRTPEQKMVTRTHAAGCSARTKIRPEKDKIILLDYSNLLLTDGCSLQGYLQVPQADGSFKLVGM